MRKAGKKKIFPLFLFSMLAAMSLYFIVLLVSLAGFLNPEEIPSILASIEIRHAIRLTFLTATVSSLLALVAGIPCAYVLSRYRFKGCDLVDTLLDLPIVLSPVAVGTGILLLFQTGPGQWFSQNIFTVVFSWTGIIMAQFTVVSALAIRLLKAAFDEINPRYEKVARVLGHSPGSVFLKVSIPMAKRGILSAWILTWARAVGEFGATVTVAGAIALKTETLSTSIYLHLSTVQISHAAFIMALMVCIALAVLFLSRMIMKGRAYS